MTKIFSLLVYVLLSAPYVHGATYYVSSSGSDTYSSIQAQNSSTPWRTPERSKSFLQPGDSLLLKRGDVFGPMDLSKLNGTATAVITIGAYGNVSLQLPRSSSLRVISDLSTLKHAAGNIYSIHLTSAPQMITAVYVNGQALHPARQPNRRNPHISLGQTGETWKVTKSINMTAFQSDQLAGLNFVNGWVHVRTSPWSYDARQVIAHSSNGTIVVDRHFRYSPPVNNGFYMTLGENNTADSLMEFSYNANTSTLTFVYQGSVNSVAYVIASSLPQVNLDQSKNVLVQDLQVEYSPAIGISLGTTVENIALDRIQVLESASLGISAGFVSGFLVSNSLIQGANRYGISVGSGTNVSVIDSNIMDIGTEAGVDDQGVGASLNTANEAVFRRNNVTRTGYSGISTGLYGAYIINNTFTDVMQTLSDGGAIYRRLPTVSGNYLVQGNVIIRSQGNVATSYGSSPLGNGIYMDDLSTNATIVGNIVRNCTAFGILLHRASNCTVTRNWIDNSGQYSFYALLRGSTSDDYNHGNIVSHNFMRQAIQGKQVVSVEAPVQPNNDIRYDGNVYCSNIRLPLHAKGPISSQLSHYNFTQWQTVREPNAVYKCELFSSPASLMT